MNYTFNVDNDDKQSDAISDGGKLRSYAVIINTRNNENCTRSKNLILFENCIFLYIQYLNISVKKKSIPNFNKNRTFDDILYIL